MEKIIHISSGRGPLECAFVVKSIMPILILEAQGFQLKTTVVERKVAPHPLGLNSVTLLLKGQKIDLFMKQWEGSVLWKSKSPFRPQHQRKNWYVEVFGHAIPKINSVSDKDVTFQAIKSSGPGGQHVNKTNSAVRATHIPSGVSVLVQDSRSQHQNKKIALVRLAEEINQINQNRFKEFENEQWLKKINVQRGNPTRVFEGKDFKAVQR